MLVQNYNPAPGNLGLTMTGPAAAHALDALVGDAENNFIGMGVYTMQPHDPEVNAPLEGSSAANILEGGAGRDILSGGAGDDRLYGGSQISAADAIVLGNTPPDVFILGDWLSGGTGNDILIAGQGSDVLMGGDGEDLMIGGAGNDDIAGDYSWVAPSFDWTVTTLANGVRNFEYLLLNGGTVPSEVPTTGAADVIYAGEGSDHAWGGFGNDILFGEGDDDFLYGDGGNDYLEGGKGNDFLDGGAGRDIYVYNRGDGKDHIGETTTGNILRFGDGINSSDITIKLGSLMLDLGNGDEIHIDNFDRNDVFNIFALYRDAANDECIAHHWQCERRAA